jgi:hypothetical protein
MPDWLVPLDDVWVERLRTCTQGGGPAGGLVVCKVWEGRAAVANVPCQRCKALDPTGAALMAQLRQRSGTDGKEESGWLSASMSRPNLTVFAPRFQPGGSAPVPCASWRSAACRPWVQAATVR